MRISGDEPQPVAGQRLPGRRRALLDQAERQVFSAVRHGDPEPVHDVPEPGHPAVLAGQHDPPLARGLVVRERAERLVVVLLVVLPVLQRAVGVDAGLVRERVPAHAGLPLWQPAELPRDHLVRPRDGRLAVAEAVLAQVAGKGVPGPNIDFALAVLTQVAGMAPGAGEAVFAIARTAGWIAHAIEEYERNTPLRPRAVYTGPPTQDS